MQLLLRETKMGPHNGEVESLGIVALFGNEGKTQLQFLTRIHTVGTLNWHALHCREYQAEKSRSKPARSLVYAFA